MNQDQVKGALNVVAGKVQQKVSKIKGTDKQQAKGNAKQVEGKVQESADDTIVNIKDIAKGQW